MWAFALKLLGGIYLAGVLITLTIEFYNWYRDFRYDQVRIAGLIDVVFISLIWFILLAYVIQSFKSKTGGSYRGRKHKH